MRLSFALSGLLMVGCAGPHSDGALWAQQNLERERAMFRMSDVERGAQVRAVELSLADEALAAERARIDARLQTCPGSPRAALAPSTGNRVRDSIRLHTQGDATRAAAVAQIGLADWRLRRAAATGDARFCIEARQALGGVAREPVSSDVLASLGEATVARDPGYHPTGAVPAVGASGDPVAQQLVDISLYASGWMDSLTARSPLPQYLAATYGGQLVTSVSPSRVLAGEAPELVVDRLAPMYPEWEPDALYAALSAP